MRLLNTTTFKLHTFFDNDVPKYVILSHRWDAEEVTFQDLESGRGPDMPSYAKIQGCCSQARNEGWEYVWIDSCCIDKSSSAELSEAINSMFKWYEQAQICYAYLSDVDSRLFPISFQLRESAWFTRGWTLQELLAPANVVFYDKMWIDIGTKRSLKDDISSITGIRDLWKYQYCCAAEKLSWASRRKTTRIEDEAYCLMGLFDINMPLLYGEGEKAFRRLQEAIMMSSEDQSLFAWTSLDGRGAFLAPSTECFMDSYNIRHKEHGENSTDHPQNYFPSAHAPLTISNKGIHTSLFLIPVKAVGIENLLPPNEISVISKLRLKEKDIYIALLLDSTIEADGKHPPTPAIFLRRTDTSDHIVQQPYWTCMRIFHRRTLAIDLHAAKVQCQKWLELAPITDTANSSVEQQSHALGLKEIVVRTDPRWHLWAESHYEPQYPATLYIMLKVDSLSSHNIQISAPFPAFYYKDGNSQVGPGQYCLGMRGQTTAFSWGNGYDEQICFRNLETGEAFLLLVSLEAANAAWKSPLLVLLSLGACPVFDHGFLMRLLQQWREIQPDGGQQAIGCDRVSCILKDGSTLSSSARLVNGLQYRFIIDFEINKTPAIKWPLAADLRNFTEYLREMILSRDWDRDM
ncbi:hypothetical protein VTL71DRAFT_13377 [Oculimacula yallundae]|uniref:Heterokaryon incompatibility domain-containing protein n=1 Tax=Oculimacula yallundae TaxID=86028 RepID=A0ABR4CMB2_9HELO